MLEPLKWLLGLKGTLLAFKRLHVEQPLCYFGQKLAADGQQLYCALIALFAYSKPYKLL